MEAAANAESFSGHPNQQTSEKRNNVTQLAGKQHEKKRIVALKH